MSFFIIIIVVLIILIFYLIYLLYSKFKNDTINNISVKKKLQEINNLQVKSDGGKKNITLTLKQNEKLYSIELELYDDDLPITCKNFRHMAFEGIKNKTYNNTKFYKISENKSIEGGDILNNDGTGEISLYGKYFLDESFKYNHSSPGVLSMVNNMSNKNTSKFIITTKCCPELDGQQVVFGRVVSGLCHLFKLSHSITDEYYKPLTEIEIIDIN